MRETTINKYEKETSWFCDKGTCKIKYDHGVYSTQDPRFSEIQQRHSKCPNFQNGIPPNDLAYGVTGTDDDSHKSTNKDYNEQQKSINDKAKLQQQQKKILVKTILSVCNIQSLQKDNDTGKPTQITVNSIFDEIIDSETITGITEYQNGDKVKQDELKKLIIWCIKIFESDPVDFIQSLLESQNTRFAHIDELSTADQFNAWVWTDNGETCYWSNNSGQYILEKIKPYANENFNPTSHTATESSKQLSASRQTLKVNLSSKKYNKEYQKIIINDKGQYYDLETGKIRNIDPSRQFFKDVNLSIKFQEETQEEPTIIFDFLKNRFNDKDAEILLDFLAGMLLHTNVLHAKPKMLYIVGKHDTFKSLIIEIISKILHHGMISSQPLELLSQRFGASMVMNKMLNCLEESSTKSLTDASMLKELITKTQGHTEVKNERNQVYVNRFPRHLILTNKLPTIPEDDDDDSIFTRTQYIEINDIPEEDNNTNTNDDEMILNWRDILDNTQELSKLCMWLLNRAHEIYTKQKPIKMQSIAESKIYYNKLTRGTFDSFLKEKYEKTDSKTGTNYSYMWYDYKQYSGSSVSKTAFNKLLDNARLLHEKNRYSMVEDTPNVFSTLGIESTTPQKIVVLGYVPKITKKKNNNSTSNNESLDNSMNQQDDNNNDITVNEAI